MKLPAAVHRTAPLSAKTRAALSLKPQVSYVMKKPPGAAPPPTLSWEPAPAHDADLAWPITREGADDFVELKSRGDAT